jgi:hypothetical protein
VIHGKLKTRQATAEVHRKMQRKSEREQRNHQREDANIAIAPREKRQQQRATQRCKKLPA